MARHTKILLLGLLIVAIGIGVTASIRQERANQSIVSPLAEVIDTKAEKIAKLEAVMMEVKDKESQEYKAAKQEWCALRSRPAAEREQAVASVRQFLGMPDVPVEFTCGRGDSEYYTAAGFMVTIDPETNYIIETGEAERRWGTKEDGTRWFDPAPQYDETPTYTTPAAIKPIAEAFMRKHKDILGVDIDQMAYEYVGSKVGNFFIEWSNKGKTVRICILQSGQVANYSTQ